MEEQDSSRPSRGGLCGLVVWLVLVIALSLLGGLGAGSYMLLEQATRTPTITDIAQSVCTDYTTQNYQLLINQIEPGPITGGSSLPNGFNLSGQFDSNAKSQLTSALQTLDRSSGRVISCQQHQLTYQGSAANPSRAQFIFQMHRSGTPKVYSSLMNFTQASGTWLITRDSNFVGTPG